MYKLSKFFLLVAVSILFINSHCYDESDDQLDVLEVIDDEQTGGVYCTMDENANMEEVANLIASKSTIPEDKLFYKCVFSEQYELIKEHGFDDAPWLEGSDIHKCCRLSEKLSADETACQELSEIVSYCMMQNEIFTSIPTFYALLDPLTFWKESATSLFSNIAILFWVHTFHRLRRFMTPSFSVAPHVMKMKMQTDGWTVNDNCRISLALISCLVYRKADE
ncbi:hypothetical protein RF11_14525 [Thelohanellus kitauei]|uniref:Uncharacterized protein n=1 Tax=Thelohanellus kitauei TaxID=669202 RepID=A0A0C2MWM8_THEKT|nr:hypothetical protein RF11_14525 [Thelohanellus kitauei]